MAFFIEAENNSPKTYMEPEKTPNNQRNPRKNKAGSITLPDSKLCYKTIVIKTLQYWHKNRQVDPWNGTKGLEINPSIYVQRIFDKKFKNIRGERTVFSINDPSIIEYSHLGR